MIGDTCKSLHPSSILGQASSFPLGRATSEDFQDRNEPDPNGTVRDQQSRPAPEVCSPGVPRRVQLSRTKGWRMPPNTMKVDRSTRWGNPFPVGESGPLGRTAPDAEGAVGFFRAMLGDQELRAVAGYPADLSPLRGKSLACWCAGRFCHADVLLELANAPPSPLSP